ncbi:MAG TPA: GTPase HflX [Cytophagaceae bacterium]|jgi:GTP-binding protein HflX
MTGFDTEAPVETAVLVALVTQKQQVEKTIEYLDELAFLTETWGVKTVQKFMQRLERPDTRTYVGKGKLEEIAAYIKAHNVNMVIFDDELSPSQVRNLEKELEIPILDRSLLILNIFSLRAKTAQARTQVELARLQYMLPRLTKMWSHLERQRGGTGTRGGAGEKEIETDRRIIRDRITLLKEDLKKIDKQSITQRKSRNKIVRVAIVGYTNVGKSTIMNIISKSDVFAENKLFATVDATVRKVVLDTVPFLLSDTVGFIRKLPHTLIECFKSTLDELREADILLHVADVSHPSFGEQIEVVNATLSEIEAADKPTILVFNKIDKYREQEASLAQEEMGNNHITLEQLKSTHMSKSEPHAVFISATSKENMDELKNLLATTVAEKHHMIYPNYVSTDLDQSFED